MRLLLAQTVSVPTDAMSPSLQVGDRAVVLTAGSPTTGDPVLVDATSDAPADRTSYMSDGIIGRVLGGAADRLGIDLGEQDVVGRLMATAGEEVRCETGGDLRRDGQAVPEPYLADGASACPAPFATTVPEGHVLVLPDRRDAATTPLVVPQEDVVGRIVLRTWPLDRVGRP